MHGMIKVPQSTSDVLFTLLKPSGLKTGGNCSPCGVQPRSPLVPGPHRGLLSTPLVSIETKIFKWLGWDGEKIGWEDESCCRGNAMMTVCDRVCGVSMQHFVTQQAHHFPSFPSPSSIPRPNQAKTRDECWLLRSHAALLKPSGLELGVMLFCGVHSAQVTSGARPSLNIYPIEPRP